MDEYGPEIRRPEAKHVLAYIFSELGLIKPPTMVSFQLLVLFTAFISLK